MAWTDAEEGRIRTLEIAVNELQDIVKNKLVSKLTHRTLINLKQAEIDALQVRITSIETQLAVLQSQS